MQKYARTYPWAANHLKLHEAITDLENARKLDSSIVIDEESIKDRYLVRKGALAEGTFDIPTDEDKPKAPTKPRTSNNKPKAPIKAAVPDSNTVDA